MKTLKLTAAVTGLLFAGLTTSNAHAQNLGQFYPGTTQYQNGVSSNGYNTICGPNGCTVAPNNNCGVTPQSYQAYNGNGPIWNAVSQSWQNNPLNPQFYNQQGARNRQDVPAYGQFPPHHMQGNHGYAPNYNNVPNVNRLQPQYPTQLDSRFNSQPVRAVPAATPGLINWNRPLFGSGLFN